MTALTFADNRLYGTTAQGGTAGAGVVFSLALSGGPITSVGSFKGANGSDPDSSLTLVGETLYGTTQFGGAYGTDLAGYGTVFTVEVPEPSSWLLIGMALLTLWLLRRRQSRN